jgi:hypothetical protein
VAFPGQEAFDRPIPQESSERDLTFFAGHLYFVVDERVIETNACSIPARVAVIDDLWPSPVDRTQAHRTRFATGVELTACELECVEHFASLADSIDFRVSCWVIRRGDSIYSGRDDLPITDDQRREWAAISAQHVFRGKSDGFEHQIGLTAHRHSLATQLCAIHSVET